MLFTCQEKENIMLRSILDYIDLNLFCEALHITAKEKLRILDFGCNDGVLLEALRARVMPETMLCGVDIDAAALERARGRHIANSEFFVITPSEQLPIMLKSADICIMSRVLHELAEQGTVKPVLKEVHRVMQGFGTFGIIEFKKDVNAPFGPPLTVKLSPGAAERMVIPAGFRLKNTYDLGTYFYLSTFAPTGRPDQFAPPQV